MFDVILMADPTYTRSDFMNCADKVVRNSKQRSKRQGLRQTAQRARAKRSQEIPVDSPNILMITNDDNIDDTLNIGAILTVYPDNIPQVTGIPQHLIINNTLEDLISVEN